MDSISLSAVGGLSQEVFLDLLGAPFAGQAGLAERALGRGPFVSLEGLYTAVCEEIYRMEARSKEEVLRGHTDLGGGMQLREAGELTEEELAREGLNAGVGHLSSQDYFKLYHMVQAYRGTFGIPFILCLHGHTPGSIFDNLSQRVQNDRETEMLVALQEVMRNVWVRISQVVAA